MKTYDFAVVAFFPDELNKKIETLRNNLSTSFGPKQALTWPPHLTLRSGFLVPDDKVNDFVGSFGSYVKSLKPVTVKLDGFSFHDDFKLSPWVTSPYVVSINVEKTSNLLNFHSQLAKFSDYAVNKNEQTNNWKPHVTAAYNDVDENAFNKMKSYLLGKKFQDKFSLDEIVLLTGEDHQIFKRFIVKS